MSTRAAASHRTSFRLGFLPLVDAAPFIAAVELGTAAKFGISLQLQRQPGWATVRDLLVRGELDASQALAGLLLATSHGIGCLKTPLVTGLLTNTHGNGICVSRRLYERGVTDGDSLAPLVQQGKLRAPLIFGVVHLFSSHNLLLRHWFRKHHLREGYDYQLVVIPPELMARNLEDGHLDGFCVGEPWSSAAALTGAGYLVETTGELMPLHVEKALAVRASTLSRQRDEVVALHAAVLEACRLCDQPEVREELVNILARPEYLDVPREWIANSLLGTGRRGFGAVRETPDFHVFSGDEVNRPTPARLGWIQQQFRGLHLLPDSVATPLDQMFLPDLFEAAAALQPNASSLPTEATVLP